MVVRPKGFSGDHALASASAAGGVGGIRLAWGLGLTHGLATHLATERAHTRRKRRVGLILAIRTANVQHIFHYAV
jgi:hypothetical protein